MNANAMGDGNLAYKLMKVNPMAIEFENVKI